MFGLTVEKLFLVAIIAAVLIGPRRLPLVAERIAGFVRAVRAFTETARRGAEADLGMPMTVEQWRALDPRQYDPRRIVADALQPAPAAVTPEVTAP